MQPNKRVLFISFDYPPSKSVAGQRTLRMTQYLPEFGWQPLVLTAKNSAYEGLDESQEIPKHMYEHIYRTGALDVDRHLSINGKHLGWMKAIDRWSTWIPGAIIKGINIIKKYEPEVIVATYPTMSAHIVGNILAKITRTPLVLDYQDPYAYIHKNNVDALKKKISYKVEKSAIKRAHSLIFVTEQAMSAYRRFHCLPENLLCTVIENGYDESNFTKLDLMPNTSLFNKSKYSLYYSGVLYPDGRDPTPLFNALSLLKKNGIIAPSNFELVFQGSGNGSRFRNLIAELQINEMVKFEKSVSFLESLKNMMAADALCLIQDAVFKLQIPGKLYEYIRAKKPILVCAPTNTATAYEAQVIPYAQIGYSKDEIAECIIEMIGKSNIADLDITHFSRKSKARKLATHLTEVLHG
ncbi:glycosyltransferase [Alteromonas macleodii]|uniref:glycosyltransferase n=2 Tax=Alteromonas macleodii TaxID=28108 RepID=UPI00027E63BA|nr:hypothetical protein MASE_13145 [Alteromonas macleodii ATCC 27126]